MHKGKARTHGTPIIASTEVLPQEPLVKQGLASSAPRERMEQERLKIYKAAARWPARIGASKN